MIAPILGNAFDDVIEKLRPRPAVYMAGKIRANCWRHPLVEGLRAHRWDLGPLAQEAFIYVGPFFVGCDHACSHRPSSHGNGTGCAPGTGINQSRVAELCRTAVRKSDLVFCYIDSADCYGTIAEIERAHVFRIPVVIAFAPNVASPMANDFWFVCTQAKRVHYGVREFQIPALLNACLKGGV